MKKFYLIRHGLTKLNTPTDESTDRIRGWIDIPLNRTGIEEAKKAAKELANSGIKILLTSDLRRAQQTADIIGKILEVKIISTGLLRPWDLGEFAGKTAKSVMPEVADYAKNRDDEKVPGGESFNNFRGRAFRGLEEIVEYDELIGAVTHHRVERLYKAWIAKDCPKDKSIDWAVFLERGEDPGHYEIIKVC